MLSIKSGKSAITGKIMLVQDEKKTPGFLTMHPLYEGKKIPETVEERKDKFLGFVYEPFIAKDFMHDLTKSQGELLDLKIFDGDVETDDALIYNSEADEGASTPLSQCVKPSNSCRNAGQSSGRARLPSNAWRSGVILTLC